MPAKDVIVMPQPARPLELGRIGLGEAPETAGTSVEEEITTAGGNPTICETKPNLRSSERDLDPTSSAPPLGDRCLKRLQRGDGAVAFEQTLTGPRTGRPPPEVVRVAYPLEFAARRRYLNHQHLEPYSSAGCWTPAARSSSLADSMIASGRDSRYRSFTASPTDCATAGAPADANTATPTNVANDDAVIAFIRTSVRSRISVSWTRVRASEVRARDSLCSTGSLGDSAAPPENTGLEFHPMDFKPGRCRARASALARTTRLRARAWEEVQAME
jgi:hypothetical protein